MQRLMVRKGVLLLAALLLPVGCIGPGGYAGSERRVTQQVDGQGKTGITGQVVLKEGGAPLADAYVNIYPDATSNLLGPSQFISSPTDTLGRYTLEVPPGTYYVVARKRVSGQPSGPLSPGDFYSEHERISTVVVAGKLAVVDLPVAPMKAPMFFKKQMTPQEAGTGIRGVLLDAGGKPVPGSFAIAYTNADMQRLPDFVSTLSDGDGNFTIYLPQAGSYYLAARIHAWDMPRPGELYGRLGGEAPQSVAVVKGEFVEQVKIVLTPFAGEYKQGKSRRPY